MSILIYSALIYNLYSKNLTIIMKKNTPFKKEKKPSKIHKKNRNNYDEYWDKMNEKIDYEKDRPPHW